VQHLFDEDGFDDLDTFEVGSGMNRKESTEIRGEGGVFEFERTLDVLAQAFQCRDVRGTGFQAIPAP
jgi:hypothetical protein